MQTVDKNNAFLGTEPIGKLLFKLAVPSVAAQLINMLYNIVDRIYIGHMKGDGALALTGVGVCLPIIMIVSGTMYVRMSVISLLNKSIFLITECSVMTLRTEI